MKTETLLLIFSLVTTVTLLVSFLINFQSLSLIRRLQNINLKQKLEYSNSIRELKKDFVKTSNNQMIILSELIEESKNSNSLLSIGTFQKILEFPVMNNSLSNWTVGLDEDLDLQNQWISFSTMVLKAKECENNKIIDIKHISTEQIRRIICNEVANFLLNEKIVRFEIENTQYPFQKLIRIGFTIYSRF